MASPGAKPAAEKGTERVVSVRGGPSRGRSPIPAVRGGARRPLSSARGARRGLAGGPKHGGGAAGGLRLAAGRRRRSGAQCGGADLAVGGRTPASRPGTAASPAGQVVGAWPRGANLRATCAGESSGSGPRRRLEGRRVAGFGDRSPRGTSARLRWVGAAGRGAQRRFVPAGAVLGPGTPPTAMRSAAPGVRGSIRAGHVGPVGRGRGGFCF